jgi:uncharacterized protein (TIGR03382 family)
LNDNAVGCGSVGNLDLLALLGLAAPALLRRRRNQ